MKFLIFTLVLLFSFNIFSKSTIDDHDHGFKLDIPTVKDITPIPGVIFNTNITYDDAIKPELVIKLKRAAKLMADIVRSQEFKDAILKHVFRRRRKFKRNNKKSNQRIYEMIMAGAEKFKKEKNNTYDSTYRVYDFKNNVVRASTGVNNDLIKYNEYHLKKDSLETVAATMLHEWLHKHGFLHRVRSNRTRKYTVPYGIGTHIVKAIGGQIAYRY